MTSRDENERLTRVARGTPMGNLMRQYWIPACLSAELVAGAPPMRLMLLGEQLVAFRDGSGRVGIMDHRCPHRCASLSFGRTEHDGVRCIYHGWKFDPQGRCLEMPNVPAEQNFAAKVRAQAYATVERAGLVWVYMGPRAEPPPLPELEGFALPMSERIVRCHQRECNWLQALEGDIDTSHFGFLHLGSVAAEDVDPSSMHRYALLDRAPRYHFADTAWGTMYAAYRRAEPGELYYRFSHFVFPFFTLPPDGSFADHVHATAWVPMDDTHTMVFSFLWSKRTPALRTLKSGAPIPGVTSLEYLPNSTDWFGRWRLAARRENDYLIDRARQRDLSFSGIEGLVVQDQAACESMGEIVDRTREHLAPSDRMITATRRRLLNAVSALEADGTVPPAVDRPSVVHGARAGALMAAESIPWRQAYDEHLHKTVRPTRQ